MTEYEIQQFKEEDIEEYLRLYNLVFGAWDKVSPKEQFRWKYVENPFLDHIPIFIAKSNGEIIGARGKVPHQLKLGEGNVLAVQGADAMVHPDHRRKGIYSNIFQFSAEKYEFGSPEILTGFSGSNSLPIHLEHGCKNLKLISYKKLSRGIRSPDSLADPNEIKKSILSAVYSSALLTLDSLGGLSFCPQNKEISIKKYSNPPSDMLLDIYKQNEPSGIHTIRSTEFYEWRFNEPLVDFTTYILFDEVDRASIAITVSERKTDNNPGTITIREILTKDDVLSENYMSFLFSHLLNDKGIDRRYVVLRDKEISNTLIKNGFVPSYLPFVPHRNFVVKSLNSDSEKIINEVNILDRSNWNISYVNRDH